MKYLFGAFYCVLMGIVLLYAVLMLGPALAVQHYGQKYKWSDEEISGGILAASMAYAVLMALLLNRVFK